MEWERTRGTAKRKKRAVRKDKDTVEQVHFKPDETIVARGEDFNCVYKACHPTLPALFLYLLCHLFLTRANWFGHACLDQCFMT